MWGALEKATPALITLHTHLSDRLSDLSWHRVQIWNHAISVHSWEVGASGPILAFDVTVRESEISLTLVVRREEWTKSVKSGLAKEDFTFSETHLNPNRLLIDEIAFDNVGQLDEVAHHAAGVIRRVRSAVQNSVWEESRWTDPKTSITLPHSMKPERKASEQLIFLFTSIRTKQHWLDFGGPNGQTLKSNRARIVFLQDDIAADFTYHLAIDGSTEVRDATVDFIKNYVEANGYSWDAVILAGMSKGGTSAIALGALLPECTVVALAPQLTLGNYLFNERKSILRTLSGAHDPKGADMADRIVWSSIESMDTNSGISRCYVFTSNHDPNCTDGLARLRKAFNAPRKLSVFVDQSGFTTSHVETVLHLSPLFVSHLGVLASGWRP